ncbi:MAG TPA: hypothetical protein VGM29_18155 [Polyangiaceae bacterium]
MLVSLSAAAQNSDKNAAVALFDQASKLAAGGHFADACPKFAESYRLDPQLGALMHLADCYAKNGQPASAWASFRDAADLAAQRGDSRAQIAKERAAALESQLSRISILVPPEARVPGLDVRRDGTPVSSALWGTALPVDPGVHTIQASAPGKVAWQSTVTSAGNAASQSIAVPKLTDEPASAAPPSPAPPAAASVEASTDRGTSLSPAHIAGWTAICVGAIGLGLGTVFELKRSSKISDRDAICPSGVGCAGGDQARINALSDDARGASTLGVVGLTAGGLFVVGGAALLFLTPAHPSQHVSLVPLVGPQYQGLQLSVRAL